MQRFLRVANGAAVVFSLVWLVGHATVRMFDWEFWFALGYLALAILNCVPLATTSAAAAPPRRT